MFIHKLSYLIIISAAQIALFSAFMIAAVIHFSRQALKTAGRAAQKLGRL